MDDVKWNTIAPSHARLLSVCNSRDTTITCLFSTVRLREKILKCRSLSSSQYHCIEFGDYKCYKSQIGLGCSTKKKSYSKHFPVWLVKILYLLGCAVESEIGGERVEWK
jgi:hypothetical protein